MRRLFVILLMLPLLLNAQNESKYMAGAVPEVDGKVVFTRYLNVSEFNQEQIFNAITDWATKTFTGNNARIIISDPDNGTSVAQNQNEIIARIGLFPAKVKMSSIIKIVCNNGSCVMETSRIRFTNNPSTEKPTDIITAEEYITDRYAMNKERTKVHKGIGDYRTGTIDIIDKNASEAQSAIYAYNDAAYANFSQTLANVPAPTSNGATEEVSNINKEISDKLKSGEYTAYITAVESKTLPKPVEGECAIDINAAKPAISFTLKSDTDNIKFILEMANNFTITICRADDRGLQNPVTILDCKKTQQFDKIFIGSITEVGVKEQQ